MMVVVGGQEAHNRPCHLVHARHRIIQLALSSSSSYHHHLVNDPQIMNMFKTFKRHEKLWFDDGNVIVSAGGTLFRVHKSVLSFHSSFFDGLFKLPTPEDSLEHSPDYYEGIPVVRMEGDDDIDIERIIDELYDQRCVCLSQLLYLFLALKGLQN